jgi:hypothetical protein
LTGIEDMKLRQVEDLLKNSVALSQTFKTHSAFGYQPVIAGKLFKELLQIYIDRIRPVAAAHNHKKDMTNPDAPLFLTFKGKAEKGISRRITRYFEKGMGLHITSTMIRAVMETTGHDKMVSGEITSEMRKAVSQVNTHSSAITQDYYQLSNMVQDANRVLGVFDPNDTNSAIPAPIPVVYVKKTWGSSHPIVKSDQRNTRRAVFSTAELKYMTNLILTIPQGTNFVARCLHHIVRDPEATLIFHERHTLKTDRLRAGFRSNFQRDSKDNYLPFKIKKRDL